MWGTLFNRDRRNSEIEDSQFIKIEEHVKASLEDYYGENCHHWFVERNNLKNAKHFAQADVLPIVNFYGVHPLHRLAMRHDNREYAEWLLSLNSDKNPISINIDDNQGHTPLEYAAYSGFPNLVDFFLNEENVNIIDKSGRTPLMACCIGNGKDVSTRAQIIALLSKKGADSTLHDKFGYTALDYARRFNTELMDELYQAYPSLDREAKIDQEIDLPNFWGLKRQGELCRKKQFRKALTMGETPTFQDEHGFGILHMMSYFLDNNRENQALLREVADTYFHENATQVNNFDMMPLHIAASLGKELLFKILLERTPSTNYTDQNDRSILMATCIPTHLAPLNIQSRINIIKMLNERGVDFTVKDSYGNTAAYYAKVYFGDELANFVEEITKKQAQSHLAEIARKPLPAHITPIYSISTPSQKKNDKPFEAPAAILPEEPIRNRY